MVVASVATGRKQQRASPGAAGSAAPATLAHEWNRRARTRCSRVAQAAGLLPCGSATPTDRCRGRATAPPPGQGLVASPNKILVACSSSAFGADVERRKDPGRRENNGQRQPDIEHDLGTLRTNVEDRDDTDHEAADRAACQAPGLQPLANWRFHGTILTPAATTRTAARGWLSAASIANCNSLRPGARYRIEAEAEPRRRRTIRLASQPAWVVRARLSYAPGGYTRPLRRRLRSGQARGRRSPG